MGTNDAVKRSLGRPGALQVEKRQSFSLNPRIRNSHVPQFLTFRKKRQQHLSSMSLSSGQQRTLSTRLAAMAFRAEGPQTKLKALIRCKHKLRATTSDSICRTNFVKAFFTKPPFPFSQKTSKEEKQNPNASQTTQQNNSSLASPLPPDPPGSRAPPAQ